MPVLSPAHKSFGRVAPQPRVHRLPPDAVATRDVGDARGSVEYLPPYTAVPRAPTPPAWRPPPLRTGSSTGRGHRAGPGRAARCRPATGASVACVPEPRPRSVVQGTGARVSPSYRDCTLRRVGDWSGRRDSNPRPSAWEDPGHGPRVADDGVKNCRETAGKLQGNCRETAGKWQGKRRLWAITQRCALQHLVRGGELRVSVRRLRAAIGGAVAAHHVRRGMTEQVLARRARGRRVRSPRWRRCAGSDAHGPCGRRPAGPVGAASA